MFVHAYNDYIVSCTKIMLIFKVAHNSLSVFSSPTIIFFSNGNLLHHYTLDSGILRSIRPTVVELSSDSCRTIIQQPSDDKVTYVGRILSSKRNICPS